MERSRRIFRRSGGSDGPGGSDGSATAPVGDLDLTGRTVLVTGASLGVGRACAESLHAQGANVVLVARREGPLREVAAGLERSFVVAADVADAAAMRRAIDDTVARFGALHGVVNNAGLHFRGPVESRTPEELAAMVDVNLRAPVVLTRLALHHLRSVDRAFVVNVTSLAGKLPLDGAAVYSATKFGLRAFSFALAEELRDTAITVSCVSPGPIDTGFIMDDLDHVADITFSQAICTADEVAQMVIACARDGRREREYPLVGGKLATLGYLAPGIRRALVPALRAKGRRVKAKLRRQRGDS